eukprot:CAMPEP_0119312002 /NCGR_PEP_ID=MMETSP1333-20130426/24688_1 /TAXON_ID=418940 /ORGANISM="Scyphosphaera apsteinii, Strain RCC1455" /LENGTH=129 /DNA_ID=CAMNT_0007316531 /DNA_START=173 /DNA_END=562 /DNA_ORIENTATION=-
MSLFDDHNGFYAYWLNWLISGAGAGLLDSRNYLYALDHFAENRVLGGSATVEIVQERVVFRVDEDLRATTVRLSGIRHRESARQVGEFALKFVWNVPFAVPADNAFIWEGKACPARGTACACASTRWVS